MQVIGRAMVWPEKWRAYLLELCCQADLTIKKEQDFTHLGATASYKALAIVHYSKVTMDTFNKTGFLSSYLIVIK